jgi:inosine/xanthosine triphosphate pyrophosphatase family protein
MSLFFLTGNRNKLAEAQAIIPEIEPLDIDLPEIQEIDARAIIEAKLIEGLKYHTGPLIVEDTSLSFDCFGGLP